MHTIKLNIQDSVFEKVIYFLQNLPKNEVEIVEDDSFVKSKAKAIGLKAISLKTKNFKFDRDEANAR